VSEYVNKGFLWVWLVTGIKGQLIKRIPSSNKRGGENDMSVSFNSNKGLI